MPTFEILRKLAVALSVSANALLFDEDERGPDDDLRLQFEATTRVDPDEKRLVRELLDSILLKHDAKRWTRSAWAQSRRQRGRAPVTQRSTPRVTPRSVL